MKKDNKIPEKYAASSFALSIILFLNFSVFIELIGCLMPQSSNTSDIDISCAARSNSVDRALIGEMSGMAGVKRVFGRQSLLDIPAQVNQQPNTIDMISYGEYDLDCLTKDRQLRKGGDISKVYGDSNYALAICDKDNSLEIGDRIEVGAGTLEIAGMLKYNPFSSDGGTNREIVLITSGETFIIVRDFSIPRIPVAYFSLLMPCIKFL